MISTRAFVLLLRYLHLGRRLRDAPHLASFPQVMNGERLSERLRPLHAEGVTSGTHLVLLRKRTAPAVAPPKRPSRPRLAAVEAAIQAEASRQGRTVQAPTTAPRSGAAQPFESRLQGIMQVRSQRCAASPARMVFPRAQAPGRCSHSSLCFRGCAACTSGHLASLPTRLSL